MRAKQTAKDAQTDLNRVKSELTSAIAHQDMKVEELQSIQQKLRQMDEQFISLWDQSTCTAAEKDALVTQLQAEVAQLREIGQARAHSPVTLTTSYGSTLQHETNAGMDVSKDTFEGVEEVILFQGIK